MSDDEEDSAPTAGTNDGEYYVEKILGHMRYKKAVRVMNPPINEFNPPCYAAFDHCKYVFLVKWLNYGASHNTWEVEDNLVGNDQYKKYKKKNGMAKGVEREQYWVRDFINNGCKSTDAAATDSTRSSSSASLRDSTPAKKTSRESSILRKSELKKSTRKTGNEDAPKAIHSMFLTKEEKEKMDHERYKAAGKKEAARLKQDDTLENLERQLKRKKSQSKARSPSRDGSADVAIRRPSTGEKQMKRASTMKPGEVRLSRDSDRTASPDLQHKRKNVASNSMDRSTPSSRGSSPAAVVKKTSSAYSDLFGIDVRVSQKKREEAPQKKKEEAPAKKEISFSQREKEMSANRTQKKATATAAIYSNSDIFDRGSTSALPPTLPTKKRPSDPEPQLNRADLLPRDIQPTKVKKTKKYLSEADRAMLEQMKAEAERKKKKEEAKKIKEREAQQPQHQLPPISSIPKIPKKPHATSLPPVKYIPKVAPLIITKHKPPQPLQDVIGNIMSDMSKAISRPSALPNSTGPRSSESVVKSRSDLMLKSTKKPKKDFKIPSFNYSTKRSRSPEPMDVDTSPMDDDVFVDVAAPQQSVAAPEPLAESEQEQPIRLIRQLRTKVYPLYRSALLKDMELLRKYSKTTDSLPFDKWRKEEKVWQSFDWIAMAMYRCIRTDAPEVLDMHLSKNSLRVTMTWDASTCSWKLPSGEVGEKAAKCLQKNELPVELKAPLPADFEVKFSEKLVLSDASNTESINNNAPAKEDGVEQKKETKPSEAKKEKPSYYDILSSRLERQYPTAGGVAVMSFLKGVIDAYIKLDHGLMSNTLSRCASALWRFRFIKEVLHSVPPNGREEPSHLWIVEADGCQIPSYWETFESCQKGGKHRKCQMLKALLDLLPEKLRFHSQSPFRPEVFMHCFKYGSHCQKVLFMDAGAPLCLSPSLEYQPTEDYAHTFDHFGLLLCQRNPGCVVDMLKRGLCVNSLSMRKLPSPLTINPFTFEPTFVEEFFAAMTEAGVPQLDDKKWIGQLVLGMKAMAKRLQTHVGARLDSLRTTLFPNYERLDFLTPVHTVCSTGSSHTANTFVYLDPMEKWDVFETEMYAFQPLTTAIIAKIQRGEAVIMIPVFRVQFTGGVQGKKIQPVTPVSSTDECTPLALRLADPDSGTPRPCITMGSPIPTANSDEWMFKIDSSNSGNRVLILSYIVYFNQTEPAGWHEDASFAGHGGFDRHQVPAAVHPPLHLILLLPWLPSFIYVSILLSILKVHY